MPKTGLTSEQKQKSDSLKGSAFQARVYGPQGLRFRSPGGPARARVLSKGSDLT